MRYKNLRFEYLEINDDSLDLEILPTDELVDITNDIRREHGNTDLVEIDVENDVYYNFYLICYQNENKVSIFAISNYGEKDDYCIYDLPITNEERENILFQIVKELVKTIDN